MSYGEDCYEAGEARRETVNLRYDVNRLERELDGLRQEYAAEVADLRDEIRNLWLRVSEISEDA